MSRGLIEAQFRHSFPVWLVGQFGSMIIRSVPVTGMNLRPEHYNIRFGGKEGFGHALTYQGDSTQRLVTFMEPIGDDPGFRLAIFHGLPLKELVVSLVAEAFFQERHLPAV